MFLKKISLMSLSLLAVFGLAACSGSSNNNEDTSLSDIKDSGKLVVAVSPDYPPFEFQSLIDGKNEVVGADIDLAQKIADKLGVTLEISTMSFDNVLSSVQSGKADLAISGLSYTEERAKTFDFSESYYETENAILIRAEDLDQYTSLEDFKGKNINVLKGSIEERLAKEQLADSHIVALPNMGTAINELKTGKADAVDLEGPVAEGYVAQNPDLAIAKVSLKVEDGDAKAVAMAKGSTALKQAVDEVIAELKESGEYQTYLDKANQLTVVE
ncbi:ABC transporter substrate-binding protein [Streptococcus moroccensis]|uniref:Polar amino acid transport system substrate-binding protein n=1 Tax=Streptococcus moroccensis TaxID=1451356 RepID=A0ABT9YU48_9STRE|nr:ABC transporter substrate-binding protein [Streptococcus moroccensis]MDQ0222635.1 polar amino acid transport system substrate-binding protein [Streptococcus moroccensis]